MRKGSVKPPGLDIFIYLDYFLGSIFLVEMILNRIIIIEFLSDESGLIILTALLFVHLLSYFLYQVRAPPTFLNYKPQYFVFSYLAFNFIVNTLIAPFVLLICFGSPHKVKHFVKNYHEDAEILPESENQNEKASAQALAQASCSCKGENLETLNSLIIHPNSVVHDDPLYKYLCSKLYYQCESFDFLSKLKHEDSCPQAKNFLLNTHTHTYYHAKRKTFFKHQNYGSPYLKPNSFKFNYNKNKNNNNKKENNNKTDNPVILCGRSFMSISFVESFLFLLIFITIIFPSRIKGSLSLSCLIIVHFLSLIFSIVAKLIISISYVIHRKTHLFNISILMMDIFGLCSFLLWSFDNPWVHSEDEGLEGQEFGPAFGFGLFGYLSNGIIFQKMFEYLTLTFLILSFVVAFITWHLVVWKISDGSRGAFIISSIFLIIFYFLYYILFVLFPLFIFNTRLTPFLLSSEAMDVTNFLNDFLWNQKQKIQLFSYHNPVQSIHNLFSFIYDSFQEIYYEHPSHVTLKNLESHDPNSNSRDNTHTPTPTPSQLIQDLNRCSCLSSESPHLVLNDKKFDFYRNFSPKLFSSSFAQRLFIANKYIAYQLIKTKVEEYLPSTFLKTPVRPGAAESFFNANTSCESDNRESDNDNTNYICLSPSQGGFTNYDSKRNENEEFSFNLDHIQSEESFHDMCDNDNLAVDELLNQVNLSSWSPLSDLLDVLSISAPCFTLSFIRKIRSSSRHLFVNVRMRKMRDGLVSFIYQYTQQFTFAKPIIYFIIAITCLLYVYRIFLPVLYLLFNVFIFPGFSFYFWMAPLHFIFSFFYLGSLILCLSVSLEAFRFLLSHLHLVSTSIAFKHLIHHPKFFDSKIFFHFDQITQAPLLVQELERSTGFPKDLSILVSNYHIAHEMKHWAAFSSSKSSSSSSDSGSASEDYKSDNDSWLS